MVEQLLLNYISLLPAGQLCLRQEEGLRASTASHPPFRRVIESRITVAALLRLTKSQDQLDQEHLPIGIPS